jgi:hypothetical protein
MANESRHVISSDPRQTQLYFPMQTLKMLAKSKRMEEIRIGVVSMN